MEETGEVGHTGHVKRLVSAVGLVAALAAALPAAAASAETARAYLKNNRALDRSVYAHGRELVRLSPVVLASGESRLLTGQLQARSSSSRNVEQQAGISCDGTTGGTVRTSRNNEGRDKRYSTGAGVLSISVRYLFTAPDAGTYTCRLWGLASNDSLTALGGKRTWLEISTTGERRAIQWTQGPCDSRGRVSKTSDDLSDSECVYVVPARARQRGTRYPDRAYALVDSNARADLLARAIDVIGDVELTTCYSGTGSCLANVARYGTWRAPTVVETRLEVFQLDPLGHSCGAVTYSGSRKFMRTNIGPDAHHFKVHHRVSHAVSVIPPCTGRALVRLAVRVISGSPVKIDGSTTVRNGRSALALSNGIARNLY